MAPLRNSFSRLVLTVAAVVLGVACTETVYQDRPTYNPPPDASSGFLGYYDAATALTTCGNCHVGQQQDWVQTG
ncbi:MAG TPA: hypothetical protein VMJ30_09655, partial [Gemmatimonadales bacterium]|nr:hypothetical protein [Gemmatimonadales bacterium]